MLKTIFYTKSENEYGDYWFNNKPYAEWFTLDKMLYEPNDNIVKRTIIENEEKEYVHVHSVTISQIKDTLSDTGIVRRIALYISN